MAGNEQENCAQNGSNPTLEQRIARIAELNDAARTGNADHTLCMTHGIVSLKHGAAEAILDQVRAFDAFTPDNDPYGEHDFGSFKYDGHTIFWKIDAYDLAFEYGSPDPSDPAVTKRVLTIMLASEY